MIVFSELVVMLRLFRVRLVVLVVLDMILLCFSSVIWLGVSLNVFGVNCRKVVLKCVRLNGSGISICLWLVMVRIVLMILCMVSIFGLLSL